MQVTVRRAGPGDYQVVGELTVAAYRRLPGHQAGGRYEAVLLDVGHRAGVAEVLVATDPTGLLLGAVTYVDGAGNEYAEWDDADAGGLRMLAVAPATQRRGVGEALVRECIDKARSDGRRLLLAHSTPAMTAAHRLYARLGFMRAAGRDLAPVPTVSLLGFELDLRG
jgi:ribosomal protein S18 acetylase RimI-like enzyme